MFLNFWNFHHSLFRHNVLQSSLFIKFIYFFICDLGGVIVFSTNMTDICVYQSRSYIIYIEMGGIL